MIKTATNREVMALAKQYHIAEQLDEVIKHCTGVVDEIDDTIRGYAFYVNNGKKIHVQLIGGENLQGFNNVLHHILQVAKKGKRETIEIPILLCKRNVPYLNRLRDMGFCSNVNGNDIVVNTYYLERWNVEK